MHTLNKLWVGGDIMQAATSFHHKLTCTKLLLKIVPPIDFPVSDDNNPILPVALTKKVGSRYLDSHTLQWIHKQILLALSQNVPRLWLLLITSTATTIVSHQDYCNSPTGLPALLLPPKPIINPAARVIFFHSKSKADHIIHLLKKPKLLSILLRISLGWYNGLPWSHKLAPCYLLKPISYYSSSFSLLQPHTVRLLFIKHTMHVPTLGPLQGCLLCLEHLSPTYLHGLSFPNHLQVSA